MRFGFITLVHYIDKIILLKSAEKFLLSLIRNFLFENCLSKKIEFWIDMKYIYFVISQVSVEVLEFPPLPPSPVEEADEESSDVGNSAVISTKSKTHSNRTVEYRPRVPPHRGLSIESRDHQNSLNTRSMDAGYSRSRRTPTASNSRREVSIKILFFNYLTKFKFI